MARRFTATERTVTSQLVSLMRKMAATSLKIDTGDLLDPNDTQARITFDRDGKRYVFTCDTYKYKSDNLRAAALAISHLYTALEVYGVSGMDNAFDSFFMGWQAAPDDMSLRLGSGAWWEILGVRKDAGKQELVNAFKALAKTHHPDAGGDPAQFKRLRLAYVKAYLWQRNDMGKRTLLERIREWIGGVSFEIFLWASRMTASEYRDALYEQESYYRRRKNEAEAEDNDQ